MSTLAAVLLGVLALALLQLRPATADARTLTQLRAARAAAGWPRTGARAVQVTVVTVLLAVACGLWAGLRLAHWVGTVLVVIAVGIAALGAGPELIGGTA
jgi:hypothetical protein